MYKRDELIEKWNDRHFSILSEYGKGSSSNEVMLLERSRMKDIQEFINDLKQLSAEIEKEKTERCDHENTDTKNIRCTVCLDCGEVIEIDV